MSLNDRSNNFCSKILELKDLSEKVENFYSILVHEQESTTEEKITKWLGVPDHFIQTEDLDENINKDVIDKLKKFVADLSTSFNDIDSKLNTNSIESFNYTRALIANKNIAYHISWRIRSYISIIKWNDPHWESTILNAFNIEISEEIKKYQELRIKIKNSKKLITQTEEYKKNRSRKRKKQNNKYKVTTKDRCVHHYYEEIVFDNIKPFLSQLHINNFLKYQKAIIIAIIQNSLEDKKHVAKNKIINSIIKMYPDEDIKTLRRNVLSQLTKLTKGVLSIKNLRFLQINF